VVPPTLVRRHQTLVGEGDIFLTKTTICATTTIPSDQPSEMPSDMPSDLPSDMPSDVPSETPTV
jgi:hypothetical protein